MLRPPSSKAQVLRRKARTYDKLAEFARSAGDQEQLLRMREACLFLASNEYWLDGLPPMPPANSNALFCTA